MPDAESNSLIGWDDPNGQSVYSARYRQAYGVQA
jgi:hypothetical protein